MSHFDFGDGEASHSNKGPTFSLAGQEFECWPEVPARAMKAIEVVETANTKIPVFDIIGAIQKLLVTRRWVETTITDETTGESTVDGEWEPADDADRFYQLVVNDPDFFISGPKLLDMYQKLMEELNDRPTTRSRR